MSDPWVRIDWPEVMPRTLWELAPDFGLTVRNPGDGPRISLASRAAGTSPVALRFRRIPGAVGASRLPLDVLASWRQPPFLPGAEAANRAEIERRLAGGSLPERLSALQLGFAVTDASVLPELVNDYLTSRLPELAGASVFLVEATRELHASVISIVRMMVRAEQYPEIIEPGKTDPTQLEGGLGLISSDMLGGGSYLLPAVSATSPMQIGVVARRGTGSMVLVFPEPIRSPENRLPGSLADLHQPHYFTSPRTGSAIVGRAQRGDGDCFLQWWLDRWNGLLADLLDPSTHRRSDGFFDPHLMLGRYLTVQRLLACVQSILINSGIEEFTRMELFFESLDLMDGLGWHLGSWEQLATPNRVENDLQALKAALADEPEVERVVMERCERGVKALVALREGFRDGVVRDATQTDRAVYEVLRAIRNAGHGLNRSQESRSALVSLMGHTSYAHPDLPELVWFHLMRALCFGYWRPRQRSAQPLHA